MPKRFHVLFLAVLCSAQWCFAQVSQLTPVQKQHIEVSMRMIGHQVLLSLGDSTSRILPIENNGDSYRINFESEFEFNPDELSFIIDSVITETEIASDYIVEILNCDSDQVVHSYQISSEAYEDVLACKGRVQPKDCYSLSITILDYIIPYQPDPPEISELSSEATEEDYTEIYRLLAGLVFVVLALIGVLIFLNKRRTASQNDPNMTQIGKYRFNKRNMELWFNDEKIELTSKECDLLQLLFDSANDVVERDTILKMVWDDEGDYVGRTLDVFISKLRKKLEADSNVKIANIRGVGYKLVVDI